MEIKQSPTYHIIDRLTNSHKTKQQRYQKAIPGVSISMEVLI